MMKIIVGYQLGDDDSIYITGTTNSEVLDGKSNNGGRAFIAKFNKDGHKEWTEIFGS